MYDEIKNILGDTTASPGYMSTHYYPTERTRKMLGTFVLQDSLYFGAAPYKNLSMEIIDDLHQRKQHHREVIARVLRLGQLSKQVLHGFKSS